MRKLIYKYGLLLAAPILVILGIAAIVSRYQAANSFIPGGDILFSIPGDDSQKWGFLSLKSGNLEYLSSISTGWEYPTFRPDLDGIVFRFGPPPPLGKLYELVPSATGIGSWKTANNPHLCDGAFLAGRPRWNKKYDGVIVISNDHQEIISYDPDRCSRVQTLYPLSAFDTQFPANPKINKSSVADPTVTEDGFLAFSFHFPCCEPNASPGSIFIVNLETSEVIREIENATNPVWSPDGSMLSYMGQDGIYLTDRSGTYTTRIVNYLTSGVSDVSGGKRWYWKTWLPFVEWSPDGKMLTYHRVTQERPSGTWSVFGIYTYDVLSKKESLVVDNGVNPYWLPVPEN